MSSIKRSKKSEEITQLIIVNGLIKQGSNLKITALSGGFWNDVYRVQTDLQDWIVKVMQENNDATRLYPNLPKDEMQALKLLAKLDIAPTFVDYLEVDDAKVALIYDYAQGSMLTDQLTFADRKVFLKLVAGLFAKQHSILSIDIGDDFRKLPQTSKGMIAFADSLLDALETNTLETNTNVMRLRQFKTMLEHKPVCADAKTTFLHTDAWAGNFIFDAVTESLQLIDWQCPAVGDASLDVWTFAFSGYNVLVGESVFSVEEKQYFIDAYVAASGDSAFIERFKYFQAFYAYMIAAHCCQRIPVLAVENPVASVAYQKVFDLQIQTLEEENL